MRTRFTRHLTIVARRLGSAESAATASEYATILAVVIIAVMVSVMTLGKKLNTSFGKMGGTFASATNGSDA